MECLLRHETVGGAVLELKLKFSASATHLKKTKTVAVK
jgi:hypothetical protein